MLVPLLISTLVANSASAQGPAPHALLVGVGRYASLPESYSLDGPENDVELMRRALVEVLDFPKENITTLATGADVPDERMPTREHILKEIARVAELARRGGVSEFVLHLGGHGTQLPDTNGDELDGRDEVFLPCDVTTWDESKGVVEGALRDDELEAALAAVAIGADRVVLLVDSCHSGTLLRGVNDDGVVWRELTPGDLGVPNDAWRLPVEDLAAEDSAAKAPAAEAPAAEAPAAEAHSAEAHSATRADADDVIALYAARSDERAPEMHLENLLDDTSPTRVFGVFTHTLVKELYRSGGEESFDQLLGRLRARYDAAGRPSPRPTGEGPTWRPVRISGDPPSFQVLREGRKFVVQNYGTLHDAVEGAEFEVFDHGRDGAPPERIGTVRVEAVNLAESVAVPVGDYEWPRGLSGARAEILTVPVSPRRLRITYEQGDDGLATLAEAVQAVVQNYPNRFALADSRETSDWIVRGPRAGVPAIVYRRDSGADEGFVVDRESLALVLANIFRVCSLLELTRHETYGDLPPDVEVRVRAASPGPGGIAMPGTEVIVEARNGSDRRWYLTVHYLASTYGIGEIRLKDSGKLEPNGEWMRINEGALVFTDDTLGLDHLHVVALDQAQSLPRLTQDPLVTLRSGGTTGFGRVLDVAAFGGSTRGIGSSTGVEASAHAGVIDLVTEWPVVPPLDVGGDPSWSARPTALAAPRRSSFRRVAEVETGILVVDDPGSQTILFDLDGNARADAAPEEFDAELALRRLPGRVAAFYDIDGLETEGCGRYELVLVDLDRDGRADVAHEWSPGSDSSDGEWVVDEHSRAHLVQIERFHGAFMEDEWLNKGDRTGWRARAMATLRAYHGG